MPRPLTAIKSIKPRKVRIGEVLVKKGLITQAQLEQALTVQSGSRRKLGDILVQENLITQEQLKQALKSQYWQNLTVTAFLSLSSLTTALPQIAVAQVTVSNRLKNSSEYVGSTISSRGNSGNPDAIALASNPTESNPLHGFIHPLNIDEVISQGHHGSTHTGRMEYAIDIAAAIGTPVFAMRSGKVVRLEDRFPDTGGGPGNITKFNFVLIEHDGGYRSAYLHLQQGFISAVGIKVGDRVKAGQLIGFTGNSGWSAGPHLHVEVHRAGPYLTFGQTVAFVYDKVPNSETAAIEQH